MIEFIPNKEECKNLDKKVLAFMKILKDIKNVKFFLGGSYAKNTWLPGNGEIDVFAIFNYKKFLNENISLSLFEILSKKFKKIEVVHASRDYYHIIYEEILFEIVPVLDISKGKEAKNLMDYSPLHVSYVKKKVKKKNDVRKLKALMKAQNLYGAESYIKGFSGYVLELLIGYYGSFDKLIYTVKKKWTEDGIFLDIERKYNNKEVALRSLNKSKKGIMILIDPTDKERNVAASVSIKKYKDFLKLCKEYDESDKWFTPKRVDIVELKKKGYIILNVVPLNGKKDVSLAKMQSLLERFLKEFSSYGFTVYDYGWDPNNFWFKINDLKTKYRHYGPTISMKENVISFKNKYKNKVKISNNRCYVDLNRKYSSPLKFIEILIKQDFVYKKVKRITFFN